MIDLDALPEQEINNILPKELESLKFQDLKQENFYLRKHNKFPRFSGPRESYNQIMEFFDKNPLERKEDYSFQICNLSFNFARKNDETN